MGNESKSRRRLAKVSYPYHPLELCLKLAEIVKQLGNGRSSVSKSLVAQQLGIAEKSSDFAQKIASAKTYGLLEGRIELALSDISKTYFFPQSVDPEKEKKMALLSALVSPGAFSELINQFDGSALPPNGALENILSQTYGIPQSWTKRVVTFFYRALEQTGVVDGNILRYRAALASGDLGRIPPVIEEARTEESKTGSSRLGESAQESSNYLQPTSTGPTNSATTEWVLPCKTGSLTVRTPTNLTHHEWKKLLAYVQILEPDPSQ